MNTYVIDYDYLDKQVEKMYDTVSKNVARIRESRGYSQLQLALDIGLSGNAFIARAEKRTKNAHFNIGHLVKIATILEVDIQEFFIEYKEADKFLDKPWYKQP